MKQVFNMGVYVEDTARFEKILNMYRIGLNDWDKTKVFDAYNGKVVFYIIMCTEQEYNNIRNTMYN